tara:strand:+ start:2572 stop:3264 length:693 start_codon:yes stop_codon:yes gene_type:complete
MKDSARDKIVDDLLVRYPRGPNKKVKKEDYEQTEDYDYDVNRYRKYVHTTPSSTHYGYDPGVIFDMGLHTQRQVEKYVHKRFYASLGWLSSGHTAGRTRKTNRLWERISEVITDLRKMEIPGIYLLGGSYRSQRLGHIYSAGPTEAIATGKVMFSHVMENKHMTATLVSRSGIDKILSFNKDIYSEVRSEIKRQKEQIKSIQEGIEKSQARLETMMDLESMLLERFNGSN